MYERGKSQPLEVTIGRSTPIQKQIQLQRPLFVRSTTEEDRPKCPMSLFVNSTASIVQQINPNKNERQGCISSIENHQRKPQRTLKMKRDTFKFREGTQSPKENYNINGIYVPKLPGKNGSNSGGGHINHLGRYQQGKEGNTTISEKEALQSILRVPTSSKQKTIKRIDTSDLQQIKKTPKNLQLMTPQYLFMQQCNLRNRSNTTQEQSTKITSSGSTENLLLKNYIHCYTSSSSTTSNTNTCKGVYQKHTFNSQVPNQFPTQQKHTFEEIQGDLLFEKDLKFCSLDYNSSSGNNNNNHNNNNSCCEYLPSNNYNTIKINNINNNSSCVQESNIRMNCSSITQSSSTTAAAGNYKQSNTNDVKNQNKYESSKKKNGIVRLSDETAFLQYESYLNESFYLHSKKRNTPNSNSILPFTSTKAKRLFNFLPPRSESTRSQKTPTSFYSKTPSSLGQKAHSFNYKTLPNNNNNINIQSNNSNQTIPATRINTQKRMLLPHATSCSPHSQASTTNKHALSSLSRKSPISVQYEALIDKKSINIDKPLKQKNSNILIFEQTNQICSSETSSKNPFKLLHPTFSQENSSFFPSAPFSTKSPNSSISKYLQNGSGINSINKRKDSNERSHSIHSHCNTSVSKNNSNNSHSNSRNSHSNSIHFQINSKATKQCENSKNINQVMKQWKKRSISQLSKQSHNNSNNNNTTDSVCDSRLNLLDDNENEIEDDCQNQQAGILSSLPSYSSSSCGFNETIPSTIFKKKTTKGMASHKLNQQQQLNQSIEYNPKLSIQELPQAKKETMLSSCNGNSKEAAIEFIFSIPHSRKQSTGIETKENSPLPSRMNVDRQNQILYGGFGSWQNREIESLNTLGQESEDFRGCEKVNLLRELRRENIQICKQDQNPLLLGSCPEASPLHNNNSLIMTKQKIKKRFSFADQNMKRKEFD